MTLYQTLTFAASAMKAHSLKLVSKNFHTTRGCQIRPFCPKHTWSVMRQNTRHLIRSFPKRKHLNIPSLLT